MTGSEVEVDPGTTVMPSSGREEHLQAALEASHVWVQLVGAGQTQEHIEREVALLSPFVQREVLRGGHGVSKSDPVILPKQVTSEVLQLLLTYCRYHRVPGHSDKERKAFDEKFIRLDTRRLCELTSAADSLEMKPLVDLTSRALARMIEGKSPEEIRATFNLPDDLTEEEKLEPLKSGLADARIKLLNKLYAKKRQSLAVKKAAVGKLPAPATGTPADDKRSLDQLLNFIQDGPSGSSKGKGKGRKKKRSGRIDPAAAMGDDSCASDSMRSDFAECQSHTARTFSDEAAPDMAAAVVAALASAPSQLGLRAGRLAEASAAARPVHTRHLYSDSDDAVSDLARHLQDEWQVPRAETVSTLTSLRDFRARLPNGGACSGSDAESTDSGSEDDDEGDYTDEASGDEDAQPAACCGQNGVQHSRAEPPARQASSGLSSDAARPETVNAAGPSAQAGPAGVAISQPCTSEPMPQPPAAPLPPAKASAALSTRADATAAGSRPQTRGAASGGSAAASGRPPYPRMPDSSDFQALSGVLRQFLAAIDASATLGATPAEMHSARLQLVRGADGRVAATAPSGASVELSWRFPPSATEDPRHALA